MLKRAFVALALVACHVRSEESVATIVDAAPVAVEADPPKLAPLMPDGGWFQTFTDDAGVPTYVAVPTGATAPRPIIVGLHGAQDRPDWACSEWFGAAGGRAFVVCPRGSPLAGAWAWSSVDQIAKKSAEALAVARAHFGPWIQDGPALYGGWSQAATLGALVLAKRPDLFDAAVLVELGHTPLDARAFAASIRASHVRAVAVVCATGSCETWCDRAKPAMSNLAFECETAGHRGHTFDGVVAQRVWRAIQFVENGESRWDSFN
ncbi:MAG TPA: hypothetical protein VGH28_27395 [Polyangiaceae bacterium]